MFFAQIQERESYQDFKTRHEMGEAVLKFDDVRNTNIGYYISR